MQISCIYFNCCLLISLNVYLFLAMTVSIRDMSLLLSRMPYSMIGGGLLFLVTVGLGVWLLVLSMGSPANLLLSGISSCGEGILDTLWCFLFDVLGVGTDCHSCLLFTPWDEGAGLMGGSLVPIGEKQPGVWI